MPKIRYKQIKFSPEAIATISQANRIMLDYAKQGFSMTLRQLYYVFVGKNLFSDDRRYSKIPGTDKWRRDANGTKNATPNYKWLGKVLGDGRMGGLVDWQMLSDRTRASYANQHCEKPSEILEGAMNSYEIDKWTMQDAYIEVWVEKEALEQVVSTACRPLDIRYFACRGYTSHPAMWEAAQRLLDRQQEGKHVHIIHLGDHDPSGIDMSRDIEEKLELFTGGSIHLDRIALNMDQVLQYNLPPDPAKESDSRFAAYEAQYGPESWELDALDPALLVDLIQESINQYRDDPKWEAAIKLEQRGRDTLKCILQYFPDVVAFLRKKRKQDDSPVVCQQCGATANNPKCSCDFAQRGNLLG